MTQVVISGTGMWKPEHAISNEELVESYNAFVDIFNEENAEAIAAGEIPAREYSSPEFIKKASGIESRYVYEKSGILDPRRMCPIIPLRDDSEISNQAEVGVWAAREALKNANRDPKDVDAVIVSCAYTQRSYPAIAIEIQEALGIQGFGFDMLVACSAATFAMHRAYEMIKAGTAKSVLVINPEISTAQLNWRDRDCHFIFGDVAMATLVEDKAHSASDKQFEVLSTSAQTKYSSNIRSNFGYLMEANGTDPFGEENRFSQEGRKVFKEVCPMAAQHITDHVSRHALQPSDVKRWWLHQANINMNVLIAKKILGRDPAPEEAPIILNEFANTASAGSIVAFHQYNEDFEPGDYGLICSFGAGYSIGSLLIQRQ